MTRAQKVAKACGYCGASLEGRRASVRFCCDDHRKRAWDGGTCEVCGKPTRGNTQIGRHPKRCVAHQEHQELKSKAGEKRTKEAIRLRRQGLLNDEIGERMGTSGQAIAVLIYRASRYDLEKPISPWWQRAA